MRVLVSINSFSLFSLGKEFFFLLLQELAGHGERGTHLSEYYESLRNNVMSLLEHVKLPGSTTTSMVSTGVSTTMAGDHRLGPADHFDSYLSKIHSLCTDNFCDEPRPLYDSVRSALHDFTVPATAI